MKKQFLTALLLVSISIANAQIFGLPLPGSNTSPTGTADYVGTLITNDLVFGTYFDRDVVIRTHNIERMRFKNTGLIGIGTNTPTEALDIFGNLKVSGNGVFGGNVVAGGNIKTDFLETKTAGINLTHKSNSLFQQNVYVLGNTGLGNTSPSEKLDVTGNTKISGNTFVGGNTFLTGTLNTTGLTTLNFLQVNQNANFAINLNVVQNTTLNTLTASGLSNFLDNVNIQKNLAVMGNTNLTGTLNTTGLTTLNLLQVNQNANFEKDVTVLQNTKLNTLTVNSFANFMDNVTFQKNIAVTGNTQLTGTLNTTGATTLNSLQVNQNANFASNLNVVQNTTLNTTTTNGVATFVNAANFQNNVTVAGNTSVTGQVQTSTGIVYPDGKMQTEAVIFTSPGVGSLKALDVQQTLVIGAQRIVSGAHTNYKLSVDGKAVFKEAVVTPLNWADFVFEKEYDLKDLNYVKKYIAENKHLPGVPSETEVKADGINVGEMDAILLKKIEELTLYIIKQEARINSLEQQAK
jgi:hypothetical protein